MPVLAWYNGTMHQRVKTILDGIIKTKRIANAYLFIGAPQSGRMEAALIFAKSAAGIEKEPHPDLIIIEKEKTTLKIDQIRKLKEAVRYGRSQAEYLFAIIKDAETMTTEAANSFLKVLEEPPPRTVFILLSTSEEALLGTISSRCQKICFPENSGFKIKPEAEGLYNDILKSKDTIDLLDLSKKTELNEEMLNSLTLLYYKDKNLPGVRVIQKTSQEIKRKGNKKLTADIMMLRLGDIWNKN